ncbi:hypothetical protein C1883_13540 [Pseudomonas protegens]|nr:hypothetical protein C1883_13540 [Pseudomonas protegens]
MTLEQLEQAFYQVFGGVRADDAVLKITNTMPMEPGRHSQVIDLGRQTFLRSFRRKAKVRGLWVPASYRGDGGYRPLLQKIPQPQFQCIRLPLFIGQVLVIGRLGIALRIDGQDAAHIPCLGLPGALFLQRLPNLSLAKDIQAHANAEHIQGVQSW